MTRSTAPKPMASTTQKCNKPRTSPTETQHAAELLLDLPQSSTSALPIGSPMRCPPDHLGQPETHTHSKGLLQSNLHTNFDKYWMNASFQISQKGKSPATHPR